MDGSAGGVSCIPLTCEKAGAQCGQSPDGCGGVLECGACNSGELCGGGGANRCGTTPCTPETCASAHAQCGTVSDGCSVVLSCGSCSGGLQCVQNQCAQDCETCASMGWQCGTGPDGCGNMLACGNCGAGQDCLGHQCEGAGGSGAGGSSGSTADIAPVELAVDEHPGTSNTNGIMEPGESAVVAPSWKNNGSAAAVQGTASQFVCPSPAVCTIIDSQADYGSIPGGATASCFSASGDCYTLSVGAGSRPAEDWDASFYETAGGKTRVWTFHIGGTFSDVAQTSSYYSAVEALVHHGITTGCGGSGFCPDDAMNRYQAAMWIARLMAGSDDAVPSSGTVPSLGGGYDCSSGGKSLFGDVAATDVHCKHVHYLAREGVTAGCQASPPMFCPTPVISRVQGAVMVARALAGSDSAVPTSYYDSATGRSYDCNVSGADSHFTDLPATSNYCRYANYLWARDVVLGCSASSFCPDTDLLRRDGAMMLARGWRLGLE